MNRNIVTRKTRACTMDALDGDLKAAIRTTLSAVYVTPKWLVPCSNYSTQSKILCHIPASGRNQGKPL